MIEHPASVDHAREAAEFLAESDAMIFAFLLRNAEAVLWQARRGVPTDPDLLAAVLTALAEREPPACP
jgi:hypothetical protein